MFSSREITDGLPEKRDDEPLSLRQDIADEILDHLNVALRRELVSRGGDEAAALQRVLNDFGDPRAVARKLWYQAMWSKIMTQRLAIGSVIFSMLVSTSVVVMVGLMMRQQQQVNAALLENVTRLISERSEPAPQKDLHWNHLEIKVTKDSKDGPPAEGYTIWVQRSAQIGEDNQHAKGSHQATIDKNGVEDCGYVDSGLYTVRTTTPWGETSQISFTIHPGQDHIEHVLAPSKMPAPAEVSIRIEGVPEKLKKHGQVMAISLRPNGNRIVDDHQWASYGWADWSLLPILLVTPDQGTWIATCPANRSPINAISHTTAVKDAKWEKLDSPRTWKLPSNEYTVSFDFVDLSSRAKPDAPDWRRSVVTDRCPVTSWTHQSVVLTAKADQRHEWTITLPEDVVRKLYETWE